MPSFRDLEQKWAPKVGALMEFQWRMKKKEKATSGRGRKLLKCGADNYKSGNTNSNPSAMLTNIASQPASTSTNWIPNSMMLDELEDGGKVYLIYPIIELYEKLPKLCAASADLGSYLTPVSRI
ncbi:hypothetical protein JHK82_024809 [Glycine max]|nr:hypothetical protein JHK82_024809 [Glycine max]